MKKIKKFIKINLIVLVVFFGTVFILLIMGLCKGCRSINDYNAERLKKYHRYAESERIMEETREKFSQ